MLVLFFSNICENPREYFITISWIGNYFSSFSESVVVPAGFFSSRFWYIGRTRQEGKSRNR